MKDVKQSTRLRPLTNQELIDSYDYLSGAASSQDCTGLIPSAPLSEAELDSYEERSEERRVGRIVPVSSSCSSGFRYKRQQRSP